MVKRYEQKLANMSVRTSKPIRPENRDVVYKASSYQVFSRKKLQNLIDQVVFKIQNCLKRYLLMKTARACFSLPCSRKKFVRLFRGAVDISGGEKSDRLYVSLKGPTTAIVTKRLCRHSRRGLRNNSVAFKEILWS